VESDQTKRWMGSVSFISVGVVLSSALFIAIPSVVILAKSCSITLGVAGGVSGLGVSNDGVSQPSYLVIGRYAAAQLPLAAGLLTLAGCDWGFQADRKSIRSELGSSFTFAIGSFVLLGAAAVLRWFNSRVTPTSCKY